MGAGAEIVEQGWIGGEFSQGALALIDARGNRIHVTQRGVQTVVEFLILRQLSQRSMALINAVDQGVSIGHQAVEIVVGGGVGDELGQTSVAMLDIIENLVQPIERGYGAVLERVIRHQFAYGSFTALGAIDQCLRTGDGGIHFVV